MKIIYKVQNKVSSKVYIGATTKTINKRKTDHFQKSNGGVGSKFQDAISIYGIEAFTWEQIDTANNINELAEKEKHYIIKYNSYKNGYNNDRGGGIKKKVYQYDMISGKLVNTYENLAAAAISVNVVKQSISNACLGHNISCKGFYWSYVLYVSFNNRKDIRRKPVAKLDLCENLIEKYVSVSEASRKCGISKTCISRCCRGERSSSDGFKWRYI